MREFKIGKMWPPEQNRYDDILKDWPRHTDHILEIGAGVGLHPRKLAQTQPESLVIAIERTAEKFKKFSSSCTEENVYAIHADATPWLWFFPHEYNFDQIWILYPNPEPKNKNQRWVNQPFFKHIIARLKPKGQIVMATNIEKYFDEANEIMKKTWNLSTDSSVYTGEPRTHFEKKYRERRETCYNIIATRNEVTKCF